RPKLPMAFRCINVRYGIVITHRRVFMPNGSYFESRLRTPDPNPPASHAGWQVSWNRLLKRLVRTTTPKIPETFQPQSGPQMRCHEQQTFSRRIQDRSGQADHREVASSSQSRQQTRRIVYMVTCNSSRTKL
ncbi:MAG: hypothetical protein ACD_5C00044G0001, partial [uncultured bacterium]